MRFAVALLVLLGVAVAVLAKTHEAPGQNWAVLIAGSNGYYNYRHQADICHAYQIVHKHNIPNSNVIVMMYDDIADSSENPFKGTIINQPNGPDVYKGVQKDYTGDAVNADNFLAVLAGEKSKVKGGNGKVVESGPNDNVFVFFSDHGGPGLIAMPSGDYLYAKDLVATLKSMAANNRFHQLVFYLEACESGSMFDGLLPENINIYATTASNPTESSYACYWDDKRQAYLGDVYSVNWMENSDATSDFSKWTLEQQFLKVQAETNTSHVMEWGQKNISSEAISLFQAGPNGAAAGRHHRRRHSAPRSVESEEPVSEHDVVDSRDVVLATLQQRMRLARRANDVATVAALRKEIDLERMSRKWADEVASRLVSALVPPHRTDAVLAAQRPVVHDCVPQMVQAYESSCGRFTDYSLKHARVLNNLCHERGVTADVVVAALQEIC